MTENVILVDINDNKIGLMEKIEAHKKGLLHRAFSGFIFNNNHELLLQRRDFKKYHNGGLWSNTVCSHPRENESTKDAVERRIFEELGFHASFEEIGSFVYKISFSNGLTEYEYDHIFVSQFKDQKIIPNREEVCDYKWIKREELIKEINQNADNFTFWLKKILELDLFNNYF